MQTTLKARLASAIQAFDRDEDGMETLQTVIIVAVAAVVIVGAILLYNNVIQPYATKSTKNVTTNFNQTATKPPAVQ